MRRRILLLLFAVTLLILAPSPAQSQSAGGPSQSPDKAYHLDPPKLARAEALHTIRVARYLGGVAYTVTLLGALLAFRVAPRYRRSVQSLSSKLAVQAFIFTPLLFATISLLTLPLNLHGHYVEVKYGLSVQSWPSWAWDWTKEELLTIFFASLLSLGLYALMRRSPRRWWVYAWAATVPIALFVVFITPIVVDPLFAHYEPLAERQPQLVQQIEKVVARGALQIPPSRMFEMRASEKVTTYNAYVTGVGASKRVVVWDTTARDLSTDETLFIFGHEMGHYVLHHIWKGYAFFAATSILGFWLAFRLFNWMLGRWAGRWQIEGAGDWASMPVLLLLVAVLSFAFEPVGAAYSRHLEHQADIYGLEVTHGMVPDSSEAAARTFQKLGENGLSVPDPSPLLVFWDYDHPPIAERLRFALQYRPWDQGVRTKYVH